MRRNLIVLLVLAGIPATSHAQAPTGAPFFDPLSMDRHTPVSSLSFDLGYEVWDTPGNTDLTVAGITVGGQFLGRTGMGGYVNVPLSYVSTDGNIFGQDLHDSDLMLGNIEGGGVFTKWFNPDTSMVFHLGIALPTADDDGLLSGLQDLANSPRYADFVLRDPNTTWLRLGVSPMGRSNNFLWRVDAGLDLAVNDDNPDAFQYSPVLHLSIGGGFDLGGATLLAELVNLVLDNAQGDDTSSTLSIGARFNSGKLSPGIGLILPIGFDNSGIDMQFAIAASLTAWL